MIASCYTMDLYCRHERLPIVFSDTDCPKGRHRYGEFPHGFEGETFAECKREAQRLGWVFNRDGDVTCPRCAGKGSQSNG